MEPNLPPDIKRKIALELSPQDVIKLCNLNSKYNNDICNNKDFWNLKLQRDFPAKYDSLTSKGLKFVNPKATYIREFLYFSVEIDKFLDNINISNEKRKSTFDRIYNVINGSKLYYGEHISTVQADFIDWINRNILNKDEKMKYKPYTYQFVNNVSKKIIERYSSSYYLNY